MTLQIRWTTRAANRLEQAALYLEEQRSGAGFDLVDQVEGMLDTAAEAPLRFPRVPDAAGPEVRRALVRLYGYWVIYELGRSDLLVLSVWHGARRPNGWKTNS